MLFLHQFGNFGWRFREYDLNRHLTISVVSLLCLIQRWLFCYDTWRPGSKLQDSINVPTAHVQASKSCLKSFPSPSNLVFFYETWGNNLSKMVIFVKFCLNLSVVSNTQPWWCPKTSFIRKSCSTLQHTNVRLGTSLRK